jgi:hypothetical protein
MSEDLWIRVEVRGNDSSLHPKDGLALSLLISM